MILLEHAKRPESLMDAAIMVAESIDMPDGERWRMITTNRKRTVIHEVPLAALWIARSYSLVMRMFGNRIVVMDWTTLPERVRPQPETKTDDEILIERISDLLWANRHALTISRGGWQVRTDHNSIVIDLPGEITLKIETELTYSNYAGITHRSFVLTVAGVVRTYSCINAPLLEATWRAIVCQRFLDAMEPGRTTLERGSDSSSEAVQALCRFLERHTPEAQNKTYFGTESRFEYQKRHIESAWRELPNGALFCHTKEPLRDHAITLVSDGVLGSVQVDRETVLAAESRRATRAIEDAIASTPPVIAGPSVTGSPKAAIMVRLLRDALARQPDLTDGNGTPIEPLLTTHLPRLLDLYVRMRSDPDGDHALAEEQLDKGLERIGAGLDDALRCNRSGHGDDIRVEVAFLTARHPECDGLDPLDDTDEESGR